MCVCVCLCACVCVVTKSRNGFVVSVSASHAVGRRFASQPGHTKDHHTNGTNCLPAWQACITGEEV